MPQRAPAIIISVLCAVIYSETLCGAPPLLLYMPATLPALLAGCLYMSVTSYVCGVVYGKSINKDVITCVPQRGHAQWPQPERDRDRQTAKRQRQRQRRKTPAGNAVATLRVVVSSSTCVHDVAVAGTRALSLYLLLSVSCSLSLWPSLFS